MSLIQGWLAFGLAIGAALLVGYFIPAPLFPWRAIDIGAVVIGSIGIVPIIGEAHRALVANQLSFRQNHPRASLSTFDYVRRTQQEICGGRLKHAAAGEMLPSIQAEYQDIQAWLSNVPSKQNSDDLPDLGEWLQTFPPGIQESELISFRLALQDIVAEYETSRSQLYDLRAQVEPGPFEEAANVFAPYLIAISIGLALLSAAFKP